MECFLRWALGQTHVVFFAMAYKKRPLVVILHSASNYVQGVGLKYRHAKEVSLFWGERTEQRDLTPLLIQPVNLTTTRK